MSVKDLEFIDDLECEFHGGGGRVSYSEIAAWSERQEATMKKEGYVRTTVKVGDDTFTWIRKEEA